MGKSRRVLAVGRNVNGREIDGSFLDLNAVQRVKEGRRVCVWRINFLSLLHFYHLLHSRNEYHELLIRAPVLYVST